MSEEEEFLARWSRRKQAAREGSDAAALSPPAASQGAALPVAEDPAPVTELDLLSLPSIDSIDAATDITAFLRQGIPPELSRAALRRAWSADPAIRDFIGLAENAWDFNDPNAMPGFGPLDCSAEQLQALVDRVVGSARSVAENLMDDPVGRSVERKSNDSGLTLASQLQPQVVPAHGTSDKISTSDPQQVSVAVQPHASRDVVSEEVTMTRRSHGGALPR